MLSNGPYNYNRFAQLDEQRLREKMYFMEKAKKAKPDFLDFDKDGDEKESFKKAVDDKKKGGKDVKEACECDDKDDKKKKMKKEDITRIDVIDYLMESGFTNNPVSSEVLIDNMSDAWLAQIIDELQEGQKPFPFEKVGAKLDKMRPGTHANPPAGDTKSKRFNKMGDVYSGALRGVWHSESYTL